jgi:hypothetical protein
LLEELLIGAGFAIGFLAGVIDDRGGLVIVSLATITEVSGCTFAGLELEISLFN